MTLKYKILIKGTLTLETGMHIGGSEVELEIGGIDKAVVKEKSTGIPYIPGSSLKGKLRNLIAKKMGYRNLENDIGETLILFGEGASKEKRRHAGYLIIRDAFYCGLSFDPKTGLEEKSENTIDRINGMAKPRNIERVVRGAKFGLDMILDVYETFEVKTTNKDRNEPETYFFNLLNTLRLGFRLLEKDYLGGSGTRGYGKISIHFSPLVKVEFLPDGSLKQTIISGFDFNLKDNESHQDPA